MFTTGTTDAQPSQTDNRRHHQRRRLDRLAYVDFGPDNGGMLIDVSEGGLSFQGVGPVGRGQPLQLRFTLPGINSKPIEATAELVWTNSTGKGGGLQFLEISDEARVRLQEWISMGGLNVTDTVRRPASVIQGPAGTVAAAADSDTALKANAEKNAAASDTAAAEKAAKAPAKAPAGGLIASALSLRISPPPADPVSPAVAEFLSRAASPAVEPIPDYELEDSPLESEGGAPALAYEGLTEDSSESSDWGERRSMLAGGAIILAAASLGLLLAMLGVHLFGSPSAGEASVAERVRAASRGSENGGQPFQIDVVSANNKHWVLTSGSGTARSAGKTTAPPQNQSQRAANRASEAPTNAADVDRQNFGTALQPLPMRPPRSSQPARATSDMALPSIGAEVPSRLAAMDGATAGPVRPPEAPPASAATAASATAASSATRGAVVSPGSRSSGFQGPVLLDHIEPAYPSQARQQHVQGDVLVRVTIGKDGVPRLLELVRGDPRLVQSALAVIPHWRYKPAVLNGQPVESQTIVTVSFNLR
jgi:TonB family protein